MTTIETAAVHDLQVAVHSAIRAPSVHNTQPWRFVIDGADLEIWADRSRQLEVLDPTGRQLYLSLGCAIFNARVALAASAMPVTVSYLPDPATPDLIARFEPDGSQLESAAADIASLDPFVAHRQTNRRRFATDEVPPEVVARLVSAASAEGAALFPVERTDDRAALARLAQRADAEQIADGAYRAELRAWTNRDEHRQDGVPARVVPHVDGTSADDIPIRDFDTHGEGWLPAETRSSTSQCLLVVGSHTDSPRDWLAAGEALERIWLEITRAGLVASVFTQPIEVASVRAQLRSELRLDMWPVVVLRVGAAAITPATSRRPVSDVLQVRHARTEAMPFPRRGERP